MTVQELIEKLKKFPPEMEVYHSCSEPGNWLLYDSVQIYKDRLYTNDKPVCLLG